MDNFELNEGDLSLGVEDTGNQVESHAPQTSEPELFTYTAAGKEIREDRDTVLKRASMGYHYAQNMQQLKQEREAWQQSVQEKENALREAEGRWSQYDQYSRENPEWANFVRNQWENRNSFNGQEGTQANMGDVPESIRQEMAEVRQFRDEFKGFMTDQQRQREDAALAGQIDTTIKEYSDIDFGYSNPETGQTLEQQVLTHMATNGINDFRAAFRDYYHDQLISRAVTKAKEDTSRQLQERQQQGYIAESDTPLHGVRNPSNIKSKSYFDLVDEGIQELGIQ